MQINEVMTTIKLSVSMAKLLGTGHQKVIGPTCEAFRTLSTIIPELAERHIEENQK